MVPAARFELATDAGYEPAALTWLSYTGIELALGAGVEPAKSSFQRRVPLPTRRSENGAPDRIRTGVDGVKGRSPNR